MGDSFGDDLLLLSLAALLSVASKCTQCLVDVVIVAAAHSDDGNYRSGQPSFGQPREHK